MPRPVIVVEPLKSHNLQAGLSRNMKSEKVVGSEVYNLPSAPASIPRTVSSDLVFALDETEDILIDTSVDHNIVTAMKNSFAPQNCLEASVSPLQLLPGTHVTLAGTS